MKQNLLLVCLAFCTFSAFSQKNYWQSATESAALKLNDNNKFFNEGFKPAQFKLFTLTENELVSALSEAQSSKNNAGVIIYLPVANGNIEQFSIRESSVLEDGLQSRYNNIRSYIGRGVDDASKTVALSFTKLGLHASIMSANDKTAYINPLNNKTKLYAVYARNEADKSEIKFKCETIEFDLAEKATANKLAPSGNFDDGKLRKYRLALCTTGEWSRFFMTGSEDTHQDSINTVMAAITVDLVRANQVFERDFGVRMKFVNNEDTLIFLNPATDPFTVSNLNAKCQQTCDSRIGSNGYDIGHVIHKGSDNGNAGCIGCVCSTGSKGSGFSTYSKPDLIDYFVIDYWTHEMGHQYGANHTFTFYSEGHNAQIEPGSGSTIMGYAGITGNTDVEPHSSDLFSTASIAQVSVYLKTGGGGNCPVITNTGNHAPTAKAGADRIIPRATPFILTGKANDEDNADNLSYIWEQIDAYESGANTFPRTTSVKGPVFRTYNYTNVRYRTFPSDTTILRGALAHKWESLSTVSRDLNFRFTVRDNHVGGGNNESDNVLIQVTNTAGPFVITSPNTKVSWAGGTKKTITWNVANTNNAPVNCANVKILLSTDGGKTFETVLKESTPNDGSEKVTIPNIATKKARIQIIAADNIFFDYSNTNFTITSSAIIAATESEDDATAKNISITLKPNPANDFFVVTFNASSKNAVLTLSDASGKIMFTKNIQSVIKGQSEKISVQNFTKGNYFLKITTDKGTKSETVMVQ